MRKHIIFTGALLLASAMTGEAIANCTTNQVTNLGPLLLNKTVCDATATYNTCAKHPSPGCTPTVMGIQEEHRSGGELWDYKKGSTDPIDPTTQVGTWSVADDGGTGATVSYIYIGPPATAAIPYKVYSTGGAGYDFCTVDGSPVASVTLTGIGSGCGSSAAPVVAPAQRTPTLRPTLRPRSRP